MKGSKELQFYLDVFFTFTPWAKHKLGRNAESTKAWKFYKRLGELIVEYHEQDNILAELTELVTQNKPKITKDEIVKLGEELFQKALSSKIFTPCLAVEFIAEKLGFEMEKK